MLAVYHESTNISSVYSICIVKSMYTLCPHFFPQAGISDGCAFHLYTYEGRIAAEAASSPSPRAFNANLLPATHSRVCPSVRPSVGSRIRKGKDRRGRERQVYDILVVNSVLSTLSVCESYLIAESRNWQLVCVINSSTLRQKGLTLLLRVRKIFNIKILIVQPDIKC